MTTEEIPRLPTEHELAGVIRGFREYGNGLGKRWQP